MYNLFMAKRFDNKSIGLTPKELSLLKKLNTPEKIQDFLSVLPQNHEQNGDSCMSVREVLKKRRAHCIEGAQVAALAFWIGGKKPLLMDLTAAEEDFDHVVAVFKRDGCWGAISKGNHAVIRYRDPIYRTLRELAMSYFHEYCMDDGKKTLRSYSRPLDLSTYDPRHWITGAHSWKIAEDIDNVPHYSLVTDRQIRGLRRQEDIEKKAGSILQYKR